MSALTAFHLFPNLPIEIRLKIWALNLSTPRTISLLCFREAIIRGTPRMAKSWKTDTPTPALLYVNRESRYEALEIYTPCFTTDSSPLPIYISFLQDTFIFSDSVLPYIPPAPLCRIRKMILEINDCAYFGFYNMTIIKSMKELRELEIYAWTRIQTWYSDGDSQFTMLMSDFEEARELDPGWKCPRVSMVDMNTGKEVRHIEGGAAIPGWEPPQETGELPELVAEVHD